MMRRLPASPLLSTHPARCAVSPSIPLTLEIQAMLALFASLSLTPSKAFISPLSPDDNEAREFISRRWKTSSFLTSLCQCRPMLHRCCP
ncbi:hypothetical protein ACLB1E_34915 [Escherichia coli]